MRRRLTYLLLWAVATASTIGVSYWGIRSVLVAAAPERSAPLSAADLRHAAPSPTPSPSPSPSPPPAGTVSGTASPTPGWERTPDGQGGTASKRVFVVQGGQATFYCVRGDVRVLGFTATKGYTESETRFSPDSLRVSFFTDRHNSRIWVTWRNGCYGEVTESV